MSLATFDGPGWPVKPPNFFCLKLKYKLESSKTMNPSSDKFLKDISKFKVYLEYYFFIPLVLGYKTYAFTCYISGFCANVTIILIKRVT